MRSRAGRYLNFAAKEKKIIEMRKCTQKCRVFKGHAVSEGAGDASDVFSII